MPYLGSDGERQELGTFSFDELELRPGISRVIAVLAEQ